jgi:hypothetical protein
LLLQGLEPQLAPQLDAAVPESKAPTSQIRALGVDGLRMKSKLVELLEDLARTQASAATRGERVAGAESGVTSYLATLSPAQLDAEVRGLGLDMDFEEEEVGLLLAYFGLAVEAKSSFELVQALLNLFLKVSVVWFWRHFDFVV